jgi:hypothetical protein
VTRTTVVNVSKGPTTCADLVVTLEASQTSSSSPTLEGETTLETFLVKQIRWLTAGVAAPTHLHPTIIISNNACSATLEGEATLETFPRLLEGSAVAGAAPPTHMLPTLLSFTRGNNSDIGESAACRR